MFGNLMRVLRYGGEVANVEAWKKGTITGSVVASLLSSVLALCVNAGWITVTLTPEQITALATGIISFGGVAVSLLTAATSKRAGFAPAKDEVQHGRATDPPTIGPGTPDPFRGGGN